MPARTHYPGGVRQPPPPHDDPRAREGRQSLIMLLANYACDVFQRGESRLYCNCSGLVMTVLMALAALVCLLAMIDFALLMGWGGNTQKGTVGLVSSLLTAIAFAHLAIRRYALHGSFVIDAEQETVRRYRGKRLVAELSFRDVTRVWTQFDFTDGVRLGSSPKWLQVAFASGEIFRIAKGSQQELRPVCDAMQRLGFALG